MKRRTSAKKTSGTAFSDDTGVLLSFFREKVYNKDEQIHEECEETDMAQQRKINWIFNVGKRDFLTEVLFLRFLEENAPGVRVEELSVGEYATTFRASSRHTQAIAALNGTQFNAKKLYVRENRRRVKAEYLPGGVRRRTAGASKAQAKERSGRLAEKSRSAGVSADKKSDFGKRLERPEFAKKTAGRRASAAAPHAFRAEAGQRSHSYGRTLSERVSGKSSVERYEDGGERPVRRRNDRPKFDDHGIEYVHDPIREGGYRPKRRVDINKD